MTRPRSRSLILPLPLLLVAAVAGCGLVSGATDDKGGGRTFTVAAAGDILMHPELVDQARKDARRTGRGVGGLDFGPMMAGIKPVISKADLAICHYEPVMGGPNGPFEGFPDFRVPPQTAQTIKDLGYDTCSTASNHTLDHGYDGVKRTLDALDAAKVKHTGSFRTEQESLTPLVMDVKGVKVAQISFAYGFNEPHRLPKDKPWLANRMDLGRIKAAEQRARKAGAEVVILSLHWGREHYPNPSAGQLDFARQIARETGVNLVIGHHAHVVQPMEKVDGTWIAYGLGNQIARHEVPTGLTEEGVIAWFTFTERGPGDWDVRPRFEPTLLEIPPDTENTAGGGTTTATDDDARDYRLLDVPVALRDDKTLTGRQRARLRLAFERTEGTLLNRGAAEDGLQPLTRLPE
ncbi:CapA family protein [Streptomyces tropicalis]|uniref:CapA family protein n=1 Tax=Streptomyces tropicalis TaxID=3034234 RepID=A0ABT6A1D8_9ACTN|nr:CapA family protein [Streptomyces tropicalis]MDF3298450.1 CapA family protein [Streptomyces tropicalis]